MPYAYVPNSLGPVVSKEKTPGRIVATFPIIKQTLGSLAHSVGIKNKNKNKITQTHTGSRRKRSLVGTCSWVLHPGHISL